MAGVSPGSCGGYWSPIVAAGPQSALSAVLAGFVFTAITVVLTTSPQRSSEAKENPVQRSYALQLFAAAFIILALDSYFTSITAGELACNRAYAESALSGGILGDGAILMIAGLGWLITTYSVPARNIGAILSYINWGIWAVVVIMLSISAVDVGEAMLPNQSHVVVNYGPCIIGALMAIAVYIIARRSRTLDEQLIGRSVKYAALSGLGAAIFAGLFTGIASAFAATWWVDPPSLAVYAVVIVSMFIPAVPLISSIPPSMAARAAALRAGDEGDEGIVSGSANVVVPRGKHELRSAETALDPPARGESPEDPSHEQGSGDELLPESAG